MARTLWPNALVTLLVLAGCGGDHPESHPPMAPTAGIGMPALERRQFVLSPEDLPENWYLMFAVTERGQVVYVASRTEAPQLRVVDSTGRRITAFGQPGDGPGEFREPIFAGLRGDTLRINARGRLIGVRLDGKAIGERTAVIGGIALAWHADSFDHWEPHPIPPNNDAPRSVIRSRIGERDGRTLVDQSDEILDAAIAPRGDNRPLSFPYASTPDRIWIADPWGYRVRVYDAEGVPLFDFAPEIGTNVRGPRGDSVTRAQLLKRPKFTRGPNGEAIPLPDASARLDTLEREAIPHFGRNPLHLDAHGRLWVVGYSQDSTAIDVFRDSTHLGRVMLPCFPARVGTMVAFAPTGWVVLECEVDRGDWPTELQLYRIVER